jgi:hypothetical protein
MGIRVTADLIECPNQECKAQFFEVVAQYGKVTHNPSGRDFVAPDKESPISVGIGSFVFAPTTAQPLSSSVPKGVLSDYNEAYLIRDLSPKASATLARRALQGMIRDFWRVVKPTLHAELEGIKDQCDPALYEAMMGIKSIGNIGAHPERDVSLIVDIEPGEAQALLDLVHVLDQDWYVARAAREARIAKVKTMSAAKQDERAAHKPAAGPAAAS